MAKKEKSSQISHKELTVSTNLWPRLHHPLCVVKKTEGEKKQAFRCISAEQVGDGTEQTLFLWVPEKLTFFRPPRLTATVSPVVRTGGAQKKKKRTASAKIPFQAQREVCQSGARWICVAWPRA